jgi:hypothetical protein
MEVTDFGMVTDDNDEHPLKQLIPIEVIELGKMIIRRFSKEEKQKSERE